MARNVIYVHFDIKTCQDVYYSVLFFVLLPGEIYVVLLNESGYSRGEEQAKMGNMLAQYYC